MKTLIIHPNDYSTNFLKAIYTNKPWTIINKSVSKATLRRAIAANDRIILLGHGTEFGLIGFTRYIINSEFVQQLREKEVIAVWCNANLFIDRYKIKSPLYSGMVISEAEEAEYLEIDSKKIDECNLELAHVLRRAISSETPLETFKETFTVFPNEDICTFNKLSFYSNV
jgi:hypothetical protein